ncbi:hypothetical protein I309_05513 [Cryptococcus deuterogattii LA55]|nr:hypothetical protein I309_05513 [Cryptococcus deuterogattii LA55]KIR94198.1 hypothetical protein I304_01835 [Cryptococcus deuterogattii CBS 10090]
MTSKTLPKSSSDLPSSSNLFPLGQAALAYLPLETHLENKRLKGVNPLFSLPKLQEYSSTQDRLLLSLRPDAQCRSQDHSQVSVPGPPGRLEDEMPVVGSGPALQLGHHDGAVDQETLWEQVSSEHTMKLAGSSPLRTWDLDSENQSSISRPFFLSERSPYDFYCVISSLKSSILLDNPITLPQAATFESKYLLELLLRATLGTVTTCELIWDKKLSAFVWDEKNEGVLGLERETLSGFRTNFLSIGTAVRRLELIIGSQNTLPLTSTHHSLFHALETYLTYIKDRLACAAAECHKQGPSGWNSWMLATRHVRQLAETLCGVMLWPASSPDANALPSRASALLTHLHGQFLAILSTSPSQHHPSPIALAYILSQASAPFLSLLQSWLGFPGTDEEDQSPGSQPWADLGISRKLVGDAWEYEFSAGRMPGFIPKEARRILYEAGKGLRTLKVATHGLHPLCNIRLAIDIKWTWGDSEKSELRNHVRHIQRQVDNWRQHQLSRSSSNRLPQIPSQREDKEDYVESNELNPARHKKNALYQRPESAIDDLWSLFNQPPGSQLSVSHPHHSNLESPLWGPTPLAHLHDFISRHSSPNHPLLPPFCPTLSIFISNQILDPLLAHATLISTSLVSLYLHDLQFLDHLDVLRAFWLAGDAGFMERVSSALFGKDSAGAGEAVGLGKRARTRARLGLGEDDDKQDGDADWGIGLGIGLSERSRWPPGGAELAYALRTTLLNYENSDKEKPGGSVWEDVGDRVSFAIRELPEEENSGKRARWLNPQAIEALDFLYLSYSPSAAITDILSHQLMEKYQAIHNLILRLSRVDLVLRTMYWDVIHQFELFDEPLKVGVDLKPSSRLPHFLVQRRSTRSLFPQGSTAQRRLQILRFRMTHFINVFGRYVLDSAIGNNWDAMRGRLERLREDCTGKAHKRQETSEEESHEAWVEDTLHDEEVDEIVPAGIRRLQSIHSIVLYHSMVLDKICNACLLGPQSGQQVTFKILMVLFGLVLDLGKTVKEVERGMMGWEDGVEKVGEIEKEWHEKEATFLRALERLSSRSTYPKTNTADRGDGIDQDLQALYGNGETRSGGRIYGGPEGLAGNDLRELWLRLTIREGGGIAAQGRPRNEDE